MDNTLTTTYVNDEYGIGLNPPVDWSRNQNGSADRIVEWFPFSNSSVYISIARPYRLDEGLALSTFADSIEERYPDLVWNFTVIYRDWLTIGGLTAYEIIFTYRVNDSTYKERQIAVKHTRNVYVFSYSAPIDLYEEYSSIVNESISSFQVK
ncbi:MAG: DUF1795 domain-containing protein [Candidatus Thermoplasmatota archaeon]|nr:DUF1795 domain-containing protein [Candidatus Thermoplasmatota archaeon]MBU1941484.1 DUF1795 domain-containing protein [Candidatus Thermoplasmatota archaeon]